MTDMDKIRDELTKGFIYREYQVINPQMTANFLSDAVTKYRTDDLFNARVDSTVAAVIDIIHKCEDET